MVRRAKEFVSFLKTQRSSMLEYNLFQYEFLVKLFKAHFETEDQLTIYRYLGSPEWMHIWRFKAIRDGHTRIVNHPIIRKYGILETHGFIKYLEPKEASDLMKQKFPETYEWHLRDAKEKLTGTELDEEKLYTGLRTLIEVNWNNIQCENVAS